MAISLRRGSRGLQVQRLQRALNRQPPTALPPLGVDGIFGRRTEEVIRVWRTQLSAGTRQAIVDHWEGRLGPPREFSFRFRSRIREYIRSEVRRLNTPSDYGPLTYILGAA